MSHRNWGIPTLFEANARIGDVYDGHRPERRADALRAEWRRDFWNFVAIVAIGFAVMFAGFVWVTP